MFTRMLGQVLAKCCTITVIKEVEKALSGIYPATAN